MYFSVVYFDNAFFLVVMLQDRNYAEHRKHKHKVHLLSNN